jgi:hypothetical protein
VRTLLPVRGLLKTIRFQDAESFSGGERIVTPVTSVLRIDGHARGIRDWIPPEVTVVEVHLTAVHLDYPRRPPSLGRLERDDFRSNFERWASLVRTGCDLTVAAATVADESFRMMLDREMLYSPVVKADLVRNLSYGKDRVFVRFCVHDARGDVMFTC